MLLRGRVQNKKRNKPRMYSPIKQKILLLFSAGIALSFAGTLGRQWRILGDVPREWKKINRQYLYRVVHEFRDKQLVSVKENADGTLSIFLTEKGRERVLTFDDTKMRIVKPSRWDGKWHTVLFDIPEKHKHAREALRSKLRELGFLQWQKSVFVYPHPCRDQIEFITSFFEVRPYVRYAVMTDITNEAELRLYFNLV